LVRRASPAQSIGELTNLIKDTISKAISDWPSLALGRRLGANVEPGAGGVSLEVLPSLRAIVLASALSSGGDRPERFIEAQREMV